MNYVNPERYGLTVDAQNETLGLCLPNNGHPLIILHGNGSEASESVEIRPFACGEIDFAAYCELTELADELLTVLDLVLAESTAVLEEFGWRQVQPVAA